MYARLTIHAIIGSLTRDIRIRIGDYYDDNRIHVFYLADSGTGKTTGANVYGKVIDELEMTMHELDDFTDASVAGTVSLVEVMDEHGNVSTETQETPGILETNDFVHSDEASLLLVPNKYSMKTLTFIQKACNPIGSTGNRINRTLASGTVDSPATCSFIFTSYPPKRKKEVSIMVENGLLQRTAFYPRSMDNDMWKKMAYLVVDNLALDTKEIGYMEDYINDPDLDNIVRQLMELRTEYADIHRMPVLAKYKQFLRNKVKSLFKYLEVHASRDDVKKQMNTYINRYMVMTVKFATHHAIANRRKSVDRNDLDYGWSIVFEVFKASHFYVEENLPQDYRSSENNKNTPHGVLYKTWKKCSKKKYEGVEVGYVSKTDLRNMLKKDTNYSTSWLSDHVKNLIEVGVATRTKKGNQAYFKVNRPGAMLDDVKEDDKKLSSTLIDLEIDLNPDLH